MQTWIDIVNFENTLRVELMNIIISLSCAIELYGEMSYWPTFTS